MTPPCALLATDWSLFLGRFHPLLVHLPIGFLLLGFLLELLSRRPRYAGLQPATTLVLGLGAVSAVAAAALGYLLAQGGGYDLSLLAWHQWSGLAVAVTATLAFLLKTNLLPGLPALAKSRAYLPLFSTSVAAMLVAGHYGGSLTHGADYLTQYAPAPVRALAGTPEAPPVASVARPIANVPQAKVYADIVQPMLEAKCVSCHNNGKQKGGLRMDTPDFLRKGGENGAILVAGNADKSEMLRRVTLDETDKYHMPPRGKTPLTDDQIALLHWWIAAGAPFDKKVAELKADDATGKILARLGSGAGDEAKAAAGIMAQKVPVPSPTLLNQLRDRGFQTLLIAQDNGYVQAKLLHPTDTFSLKTLAPLVRQLTWLDLSGAKKTDGKLNGLAAFGNLTRLRLDQSAVTDADLATLKNLAHLEYLNLYGTGITDAALPTLAALPALRTLYLWQTRVTEAAIAQLQKQRPALYINDGKLSPADSLPPLARTVVQRVK